MADPPDLHRLLVIVGPPVGRDVLLASFGGGDSVINVIDVRQSYLQKLLKQALIAVGHPAESERLNRWLFELSRTAPFLFMGMLIFVMMMRMRYLAEVDHRKQCEHERLNERNEHAKQRQLYAGNLSVSFPRS